MKNILVPIDFSPCSKNAYAYALHLAKLYDAEIHLLHVYSIPVVDPYLPVILAAPIQKEETENAIAAFRNLDDFSPAENFGEDFSDVQVDHVLKQGFPIVEIVDYAESMAADLIIMGTKGTGKMPNRLLGSIAQGVCTKSHCPIMAIPEDAKFDKIEKVAYATDFELKDFTILEELFELTALEDATLHCIHIKTSTETPVEDISLHEWREFYKDKIEKGAVCFDMIKNDDIDAGIEQYVAEKDIDLLVMMSRDKNFIERMIFPSHTRKMIGRSTIPVLIHHKIASYA